jgi:hypothetical protein
MYFPIWNKQSFKLRLPDKVRSSEPSGDCKTSENTNASTPVKRKVGRPKKVVAPVKRKVGRPKKVVAGKNADETLTDGAVLVTAATSSFLKIADDRNDKKTKQSHKGDFEQKHSSVYVDLHESATKHHKLSGGERIICAMVSADMAQIKRKRGRPKTIKNLENEVLDTDHSILEAANLTLHDADISDIAASRFGGEHRQEIRRIGKNKTNEKEVTTMQGERSTRCDLHHGSPNSITSIRKNVGHMKKRHFDHSNDCAIEPKCSEDSNRQANAILRSIKPFSKHSGKSHKSETTFDCHCHSLTKHV